MKAPPRQTLRMRGGCIALPLLNVVPIVQCRHATPDHRALSASDAPHALCPQNLIGSHASLPENSDVALSVIPEDYIELLRCSGDRHRALSLHSRANVRDIHRLRDVLTDLVEDRLRNRPWIILEWSVKNRVQLRRSRLLAPVRLPSGYGHLLIAILTMSHNPDASPNTLCKTVMPLATPT